MIIFRRLLKVYVKDNDDYQRLNIFRTRCLVGGNFLSLIIDGGSCKNVASTRLVKNLA